MEGGLINPNPKIHERRSRPAAERPVPATSANEATRDEFDAAEIFDHIRDITDPEHPYTLEQLNVVSEEAIDIDDNKNRVLVKFTPTVQHCSMATLIGLCIRVKLMRSLPQRFKGHDTWHPRSPWELQVDIQLAEGSHASEVAVNKQLNDKERVAAALENENLADMVNRCLSSSEE